MQTSKSIALAVGLVLASAAIAGDPGSVGPQSSATPYVVPTAAGWDVTSLLTVGDSAKESAYRLVGIPDGMGALAGKFAENGTYVADKAFMTVFLNHEIRPDRGIARAHGTAGAFVSQWTVHLNSLQVKWGEDLVQRVYTWQPTGNGQYGFADTTGTTAFNRFCSADLPAQRSFYDAASGKGFAGRIFMNGEESGDEGRAFAHVVSGEEKGTSYELPYLGKFSWENSVAHPDAGERTLVVGLDDSTPGQLYVYAGDKQDYGNPVERAGLQYGKLYGVRVPGLPLENNGPVSGTFELVDLSAVPTYVDGNPAQSGLQCALSDASPVPVARQTGVSLQCHSAALGITEFARPEDGHWDTRDARVFYWVTTGATLGGKLQTARLYRLRFDSLSDPTGGMIELVRDAATMLTTGDAPGTTARSFDNITVDADGQVIVQEDPGNSSYIAKTWRIDPVSKDYVQIFESDRARFVAGAPGFLTQDEENSGVIEVTDIVRNAQWYEAGRRYYLGNMQAHYPIAGDPELVESGQLYLMASPAQAEGNRRR